MSRTGRPFSALAIAGSRLREPLCLYRSIFWTTRWSVQAFRTALEGGHRSYPISEEQEPDGQNKPKDGGKSNNRNPEVAERILEVIQHSPVPPNLRRRGLCYASTHSLFLASPAPATCVPAQKHLIKSE